METCDTGSLPFDGDLERFLKGARPIDPIYGLLFPSKIEEAQRYFDEKVVETFIQKVGAGIGVPNYPQFRDMNEMFLDAFTGIERTPQGYVTIDSIGVKLEEAEIPEVAVLKRHTKEIAEKTGSPLRLKVCVTGPYTLASMLRERHADTFLSIADAISKIVQANIFNGKYGGVRLLFVDEPLFGLVDDPLLDFGQKGRETLLRAWKHVLEAVSIKEVKRGFHLHSTRDGLFWDVKPLEILESHVNDPFYESSSTKEKLERTDKFIKASITVTDFDSLIRRRLTNEAKCIDESTLNEKVGETWKEIGKNLVDPLDFLEEVEIMRKRLKTLVSLFGEERVPYAGPECGLRSFPTLKSALELLRRVTESANSN